MSLTEILILIVAGVFVGFINTLAGGGSIISLSVLMMLGLPPSVANGTNRIGIAIQTLTAVTSFKQQKVLPVKKSLLLAVPAVIGALAGSFIAVDINEDSFKKAIGVIMLVMLVFVLYNPKKYIYGNIDKTEKPLSPYLYIIFFFIGLYGGFIHMGVGYFLLMGIVLGAGFDLVKANAVKVLIILTYTPFTLAVFILYGKINWWYGLTLAVGSLAGAFIASRLAVKRGVDFVKWIIVSVVLFTAGDMFGFYDFKEIAGFFVK